MVTLSNHVLEQYRARCLADGADFFEYNSAEFACVPKILRDRAHGGGRSTRA